MKSFVFAVLILAIADCVTSKCSDEGEKVIKKCYTKYLTDVPLTVSPDSLKLGNLSLLTEMSDENMKKAFEEKKKCIAGYENDCLNIKAFSNAFKASFNDSLIFVFLDFTLDYMVEVDPKTTKEESKCFSSFTLEGKCPLPKGCLGLEKYIECAKELLIKKCHNAEVAQVFRDALMHSFKKVLPICGK